jgi:hypothetical protein
MNFWRLLLDYRRIQLNYDGAVISESEKPSDRKLTPQNQLIALFIFGFSFIKEFRDIR